MAFSDNYSKKDICVTLFKDHHLCWKGKKALEMCQYPVMPQRKSVADKRKKKI